MIHASLSPFTKLLKIEDSEIKGLFVHRVKLQPTHFSPCTHGGGFTSCSLMLSYVKQESCETKLVVKIVNFQYLVWFNRNWSRVYRFSRRRSTQPLIGFWCKTTLKYCHWHPTQKRKWATFSQLASKVEVMSSSTSCLVLCSSPLIIDFASRILAVNLPFRNENGVECWLVFILNRNTFNISCSW